MKTAFVYPGQGSQYVGMGLDFLEEDPEQAAWFESVCDRLDFPLRERLEEGPPEALERTRVTQPAVFVVNHLVDRSLRAAGLEADAYAGHSLGEYNALVAGGWASFEGLLPVVALRGRLMDEQAEKADGGMAAVLKLDPDDLRALCDDVSTGPDVDGTVEVALYNGPGQLVVSGSSQALEELVERAGEAGALKAVELDVSGPWHSQYMAEAQPDLHEALGAVTWSRGDTVVTNVTGEPLEAGNPVRDLVDQLVEPVRWVRSIRSLLDRGVTRFVEVGPGDVLSGLIKRIGRGTDAELEIFHTDTLKQTLSTIEAINDA